MTSYELYINGTTVDLASDSDITLVYQSGIFTKLDEIQSNRAFNIDLPMTPRNIRILQYTQRPDVDSDTPYTKLSAALYKSGVPIFEKGWAYITEISDVISVTLTWGNAENFDPLFDSNLSDLAPILYDKGIGSIDWNANSTFAKYDRASAPRVGFFKMNFGQGFDKPEYWHPSISVDAIIEAIEEQHGITIDGKERLYGDGKLPDIIALTSKNGDSVSNEEDQLLISSAKVTILEVPYGSGSYSLYGYVDWTNREQDRHKIFSSSHSVKLEQGKRARVVIGSVGGDVADFAIAAPFVYATAPVCVEVVGHKSFPIGEEYLIARYEAYNVAINPTESGIIATFHSIDVGFDVRNDYDIITIQFKVYLYSRWDGLRCTFATDTHIKVWQDWDNCIYPTKYPIAANLPDIEQGEFLNALMQLRGLYAYADPTQNDTIKLMSADDIINNVLSHNFVDWSDKVLLNNRRLIDMPDRSEFQIEDYAQRNTLNYDNDSDVYTNTEGEINIINTILDKETEIAEVPLSASENKYDSNNEPYAVVPLYEKGSSDTEPQYESLRHRILAQYADADNIMRGYFDPRLNFSGVGGIVATKYAGLQTILRKFRLITVRAKLTALDLYNLKYHIPVYIRQFGQFFAIYNVQTGENDICECQLIKLPVAGTVANAKYVVITCPDFANTTQTLTFTAEEEYGTATISAAFNESGVATIAQNTIYSTMTGNTGNFPDSWNGLYMEIKGYNGQYVGDTSVSGDMSATLELIPYVLTVEDTTLAHTGELPVDCRYRLASVNGATRYEAWVSTTFVDGVATIEQPTIMQAFGEIGNIAGSTFAGNYFEVMLSATTTEQHVGNVIVPATPQDLSVSLDAIPDEAPDEPTEEEYEPYLTADGEEYITSDGYVYYVKKQ